MNLIVEQPKDNLMYGLFAIISSGGLLLSYSFNRSLSRGQLVCVPLKQKKTEKQAVAVFLGLCDKPKFDCKEIIEVMPHEFALKKAQLNLLEKVSAYYLTPIEWSMRLLAPGFFWNLDKFASVKKYYDFYDNQKQSVRNDHPIAGCLTTKQKHVYNFILKNLTETILLRGVTGSGKTEIYLSAAQHVLNSGKSCLILVPEISLTPQMAFRFNKVFGDELSVLHSGISSIALLKEWIGVYKGKKRIVLGVRSAVFCPLDNIGLIVVDEEHDQSYKASDRPCYHARDVAVMRAKLEGACCLLGSATPSIESYFNATQEKYKYIELNSKHAESTKVETIVFETKKNNNKFKLNRPDDKVCHIEKGILDLLSKNFTQKYQSIVLLNRRGYVNYALCESCRTPLSCPNCSVATTLHNFGKREICHYCDYNQEIRKSCPSCQSVHFLLKGVGTQNIEAYLKEELKDYKVERLDRDTLTSHSNLTKILSRFTNNETDCLVGTQILAKGHDFPNVTLIVILNLEDGLFLPDFRSAEKTFHLLTQSMGRVGRGSLNGIVALQSMVKSHPIIELALQQNVPEFLKRELKNRERASLPPLSRLILIELKHKDKILLEKKAKTTKEKCIEYWKSQNLNEQEIFLSGPHEAPIEKINQIHRMHICIHTAKKHHPLKTIPKEVYSSWEMKNIVKIDVDPQNFM